MTHETKKQSLQDHFRRLGSNDIQDYVDKVEAKKKKKKNSNDPYGEISCKVVDDDGLGQFRKAMAKLPKYQNANEKISNTMKTTNIKTSSGVALPFPVLDTFDHTKQYGHLLRTAKRPTNDVPRNTK